MKKTFFAAVAVCSTLSMTSCSNEENIVDNTNQNTTLEINPTIASAMQTSRAGVTSSAFTNGEVIGLYIYRGDGITSATEYADVTGLNTKNVPYTETTGKWMAANKIILSNVIGKVYAYYPHESTYDGNDGKTIPVSVSASQGTGQSDGKKDANGQIDYMWATPVENVSNKTSSILLQMNHALAKLTFKFVQSSGEDTYPGVGQVTSIELKNASEKSAIKNGNATMNIGNGALNLTSAIAGSVKVSGITTATLMDVTAPESLPSMLVYPGTIAAEDAILTVVVDGTSYTVKVPAQTYLAGKNYVYTFTLKGTGLSEDALSVQITRWDDVPLNGGNIQNPD